MNVIRDRRIVAGGAALLAVAVVAAVSLGWLTASKPSPTASPSAVAGSPSSSTSPVATSTQDAHASGSSTATPSAAPPSSGSAYADLDGLPASPEAAHRLPLAIMIDGAILARPVSGMTRASIVYQAPADGGEHRYLEIFQENDAAEIGPVRSARPYFVRWAAEYRALFGHYGGDRNTLQNVVPHLAATIYNMDALAGGSCPYHRTSSREAPHNAYTSTEALRRCAASAGYPATVDQVAVRPFVDDASDAPGAAATTISVPYPIETVGWTYDAAARAYLRSIDGIAQTDPLTGKRVDATNVVVLFQRLGIDPLGDGGHRPSLDQIGTGKAIVFRDGKAIEGTWKKDAETSLTRLFDGSGNEIPLVRGRIFFQVVATGTKVTYKG